MIEINDFMVYLICFGFIITWVLISIGIFYKVNKLLKQKVYCKVTDRQKERFLNNRGWHSYGDGYFTKGVYLNCSLDFAYQIEIEND